MRENRGSSSSASSAFSRNPRRPRITLKSPREIELMRSAGRVVAEVLAEITKATAPGVTTAELAEIAVAIYEKHQAEPLFLNYPNATRNKPPFPSVICASVNEQVVHGIPNNKPLKPGDVLAVDTGCRVQGWCGDAAVTLAVGPITPEAQRLLDVTRETLELAIASLNDPACKNWSDVARRMEDFVKSRGMFTVEKFVGHGIGQRMHEQPQVPNFVSHDLLTEDFPLEPGLVLAIEPMVNLGTKDVRMLNDHWTVVSTDRSLSAHFEHTVAITESGPVVLTAL